jgi:protein translocase SecG subunit
MSIIAGLLTFFLILNCLVLILLVLIQLPKKDAGAGMAFGAGTADALFGAGSGNALTKITKWATGILLGLCVILGHVETSLHATDSGDAFLKQVSKVQSQTAVPAPVSHQVTAPPAAAFTTTPVAPTAASVSNAVPAAK